MTAIFVTVSLIHVFLSFIEKRSTQTLKQQSMPKKNSIICYAYVFRRGLQPNRLKHSIFVCVNELNKKK